MKTVSTAFKAAQMAPSSVSVRRVAYKRRYWVDASKSYSWESSWTVLPENMVVSVSPITGKLDTDRLNEFKISNVNLVLKNDRRQWKKENAYGLFGATATYPNGFEPYWTKFRIESGYDVAGTATYTPMFIGVAVDFKTTSSSDTIQINVRGLEAILENANAENVSTLVTNENMGTGNGSNKEFTTVHPGVGIVKEVSLNGIAQKAGTDYSIGQLNEPTLGAKITFTTAPAGGVVVRIIYRYWKQDQTIESIVKDLLTEAGVPVPNQIVENVILSQGVKTKQIETTATDFNAGTYDRTEGALTPGSIKLNYENSELFDDFSDGDFTSNPTWIGATSVHVISGNALTNSSASPVWPLYVPSDKAFGEWGFRVTPISGFATLNFYFIANIYDPALDPHRLVNGYSYGYTISGSTTNTTLDMIYKTGPSSWTRYTLAYASFPTVTNSDIRIVRAYNGRFKVYHNGTVIMDLIPGGAALTYTTSAYFGVSFYSAFVGGVKLDNFYFPTSTITGKHTSRVIDLGFAASSYGNLNYTGTLNGGTIGFETRTSSDGLSWNSWLPSTGTINSVPDRYIQVRSTLTSASPSSATPSLDQYEFEYTATSTTIKLANMTGKTVYQAIQSFGAFANYEWGFKETEDFFFRSKDVGVDAQESFDSSVNLLEISNMEYGVDRVYSEVKAQFGDYDVTVGDDGLTKDGPIARFGRRSLEVNSSDILLAPDKDVATGVALGLYSALNKPKRTMKARTKLMEWIDLSDTVALTFNDNIPARPWALGDTSVSMGDSSLHLFGDDDQTAKGLICKVVGYRHDTDGKTSEFDLEEILL